MSDSNFSPRAIDAAYINSLVDLVNACRENHVHIDKVQHYMRGWIVTFKDHGGDAICHSGSYGSPCPRGLFDPKTEQNNWEDYGRWETIGFPWDGDDVSVHSAEALAAMIHALDTEEDWREYEGY